ncbi:hypothetical protein NMY22_g11860 [Coprinellus aureogranulatus]|nr:hypothetical protein NMY22_g11860 [Coprinellus aureogranulatus]
MSTPSAASDSHSSKARNDDDKKTSTYGQDDAGEHVDAPMVPSEEELALEKSARLKLDLTVLPIMTIFYLLSFMVSPILLCPIEGVYSEGIARRAFQDRANIGNARVAGLQAALSMTDAQYQICVTILFVPYICAELPANLLLRKIGPNILMPTILTAWGLVVTFQGFVSSYAGLAVVRFLLGLLEGPMFPGIVLYLSGGFYTRRELSLRIAYFFSAASTHWAHIQLSGAFSGLLAAAITNMDGLGGKGGWAWIFILEGLFTVVFGIASFWLVPRTPQQAFLLTQAEKDALKRKIERDRPLMGTKDKFTPKEVLRALLSPQVLILFVAFFIGGAVLYGFALFLPSIVRQLGFSPNRSQLLSVGPFAVGFVVSVFAAWWSDTYNTRGVPLIAISFLAIIGWAMFLGLSNKYALYGALYFMVPGIYGASPVACAWAANNSEPHYRRASSIAIGFIGTNAGGILSTWRFPTNEGPRFTKTVVMMLVFSCLMSVFTGLNMLYLSWQNKRKVLLRHEILKPYATEKEPDGGLRAWVELGDKHPDFKYTL